MRPYVGGRGRTNILGTERWAGNIRAATGMAADMAAQIFLAHQMVPEIRQLFGPVTSIFGTIRG